MESKFTLYLSLILILFSCTNTNNVDKDTICVSIEPQRYLLEQITGDRFNVVTLLANGANPESFEPTMAQRMAVANSKAFFITGFLPFENLISSSANDLKIYNTSLDIATISGTHSHNGDDSSIDPHVWTSYRNASIMARNMRDALIEIDPDGKEIYNNNYKKLAFRLDSLDKEAIKKLKSSKSRAFAVWHPSLTYLAKDYNLHQIAVGSESKEVSAQALLDIIREAKTDSVKIFFFQKEYDSRQADNINKEIGSEMVIINPLSYAWEDEMKNIIEILSKY